MKMLFFMSVVSNLVIIIFQLGHISKTRELDVELIKTAYTGVTSINDGFHIPVNITFCRKIRKKV